MQRTNVTAFREWKDLLHFKSTLYFDIHIIYLRTAGHLLLAKWINAFLVALPEMRPVQHWIQRGSCPQWPASCNAQCSVTWYSAKKKKWIKYITKKFYKSALNQITHMQVLQKYIAKTIQWFQKHSWHANYYRIYCRVVPQNVHQTKICDNIIL